MNQLTEESENSIDLLSTFNILFNEISSVKIKLNYRLVIISIILILSAFVRLLNMSRLEIDRTVWKEIDYIMVSKNYNRHGYKFFRPEIDWIAEESNVTAMELPLVPYLASLTYGIFGVNEYTVRFPAMLSFLMGGFFLYMLARNIFGDIIGLLSLVVFSVISMFSDFSHFLFTEPTLIMVSILTILMFSKWSMNGNKKNFVLGLCFFSLAISLKPTILHISIPIFFLFYTRFQRNLLSYLRIIPVLSLTLIVPILWYIYAYYLSKTSIDVFGVFGGRFGGHDKFQTFTMLSSKAWYRIMLYRLLGLLGGKSGFLLIFCGLASVIISKKGYLFVFYCISVAIFFAIVAEGNIDAPYRQLQIIPPVSVLIAVGAISIAILLYAISRKFIPAVKLTMIQIAIGSLVAILLIFPLLHRNQLFIEKQNFDETWMNADSWELAKEIQKYTEENDKLVMIGAYSIHKGGYDLSPVVYYYSGRKGWSLLPEDLTLLNLHKYIDRGAKVVGANGYKREEEMESFVHLLRDSYTVIYENPSSDVILFSLNND